MIVTKHTSKVKLIISKITSVNKYMGFPEEKTNAHQLPSSVLSLL